MTQLGAANTVLCTGTLAGVSLVDKVKAAAAAGFDALSVRPREFDACIEQGWTAAQLQQLFADHNLGVAELDPIMTWLPGVTPDERNGHSVDEYLAIADALQPDCLSVLVDLSYRGTIQQMVEPFADLCDRAAEHGFRCGIEFFAWSPLRSLRDTAAIVDAAGRPNGGFIFDNWHHFRVGGTPEDLAAIDGRRVFGVQLSDAPAEPTIAEVAMECLKDRRWPGEGDSAVRATIDALRARGCTAPLGVEVFGGGDPYERARRAAVSLARLQE